MTNFFLGLAALVSLPTFLYLIYDRYKKPEFVLDLDKSNTFLARLLKPESTLNGNVCLCIANAAIVNSGNKSATIKNFFICYRYDGDITRESSLVMMTTEIATARGPNQVVVLSIPFGDNIVAMSWSDFHLVNRKKGLITPGDRIIFNAVFPLVTNSITKIDDIFVDAFFELSFHHGSSLKFSYYIPDNVKSGPEMWLRDEIFQTDDGGNIIIPVLKI